MRFGEGSKIGKRYRENLDNQKSGFGIFRKWRNTPPKIKIRNIGIDESENCESEKLWFEFAEFSEAGNLGLLF